MPVRQYANAPATTLASSCTSVATSISVASVTGLPITFPYTLIIDRGTATEEVVSVTAAAGTTLTVSRGQDSTTGFAHNAGATVVHGISAQDIREANAHVNANSGVHGVAGSVVGTTDTQTLTNKTLTSPTIGGTISGVGSTVLTSLGSAFTTSSASFVDVTGLTFSVVSGARYVIEGTLSIQLPADGTVELALNGPAKTEFAVAGGGPFTQSYDVLFTQRLGSTGNGPEHFRGIITPSANGTLALRVRKVAGTGNIAVAVGSIMSVRRIA